MHCRCPAEERAIIFRIRAQPAGVQLVWTPGGAHNQDLCPFLFVDFAWDALLARRVEFIGKDIEHKGREQAERERRLRRY
jgi:hypothetical protein